MKISDLLDFLNKEEIPFDFAGNSEDTVECFSSLSQYQPGTFTWVKTETNIPDGFDLSQIALAIVSEGIGGNFRNVIYTPQSKRAFFSILNHFFSRSVEPFISDRAVVLTNNIGKNVSIAPGCYVGEDVEIGDNVILHPNVVIECPCKIGDGCEIFSGAVIGSDGFGYYTEENIPFRETHYKGVILGKNVDIGANTCVDRGLLTDTVIGNNVKIDNLCHIAHNATIDDNCLIVAGSIVCGSTHVGRNSYLASNIIRNQCTIGANAFVGLGAVVVKDVAPGQTVIGNPARPFVKK